MIFYRFIIPDTLCAYKLRFEILDIILYEQQSICNDRVTHRHYPTTFYCVQSHDV